MLNQDTYLWHTVSVYHCVQPEPYWRMLAIVTAALTVVPYTSALTVGTELLQQYNTTVLLK